MIPYKQLSLADIFSDCHEKFDNDKPVFLSLLETHIDIDEFIPISVMFSSLALLRTVWGLFAIFAFITRISWFLILPTFHSRIRALHEFIVVFNQDCNRVSQLPIK